MRKFLLLVLLVPFLSTCGLGAVAVVSGGVLYGFVVDALTGQRLDFFDADGKIKNVTDNSGAKTQIYVVVNGVFVRAQPCDPEDADEDNEIDTSGCFRFEGMPYDTPLAVFVQRPNYRPFEGVVTFTNPYNSAAFYPPDGVEPVFPDPPEYIVTYRNIRIFPIGFAVDYHIFVHLYGTPVPNATVNCAWLNSANSLEVATSPATGSGAFLAPAINTTTKVVQAITDAEGVATLSGGLLVPGADYKCEIFRTERFDGRVYASETTFTAGITTDNIGVGLLEIRAPREVYALQSNADDPLDLLGLGASLIIKMNRAVEVYPGLNDCWTAGLNEPDRDQDGNVGTMPVETAGNNSSETADVQVSADGLTVTISYKTPTVGIDADDRGTSMTFDGIYLRPRGTDDAEAIVRVGGFGFNGCPQRPASSALQNVRAAGTQLNTVSLF